MRLHAIDDFPFHQHPRPFNMVATTDAHYNDGYWFAFYAPGWYFVTVLRLHPNMNAIDGAVSLSRENRQHCVRASRALRPRYDELSVGPLRLEILEPMQRLRLTLGDNPSGMRMDVVFESQSPPFVEDRYQHVKYGAIVNDTLRYTQICRVTGEAALGDESVRVDRWHGMRDHSWGVRSSMGPPNRFSGTDRRPEEANPRAIRLWVPFEAGDHCGFFHTHEDRVGKTLDFEGRLDYPGGETVHLQSVRHSLEYEPGTRRPIGGSFELVDEEGKARRYELRAAGSPVDVQGLGYYGGWNDGGSAGMYRGPEHVEHEVYDSGPGGAEQGKTGPPNVPQRRRLGPTDYPMILTGPDGGEGMAHLEHHIYGPYEPYSFT